MGSVMKDMQKVINKDTLSLSDNLNLLDGEINSTGARVNNVSVVVNPQTLNNESLDQAFNYINNRFGLAI